MTNVPAPDESGWVRQAAKGDREAFARLVDCYWTKIHRWLVGLTGKQHLAEEATQEAFLKAWTSLPGLREVGTFRVWLFQIARRCWLDARRRSRGHLKAGLTGEIEAVQRSPLGELMDAEAQEQLQVALELLPSKYRAAYLLWTQVDLPYSEIAQILGINEETARWRVCKARQGLVHSLTSYMQMP